MQGPFEYAQFRHANHEEKTTAVKSGIVSGNCHGVLPSSPRPVGRE